MWTISLMLRPPGITISQSFYYFLFSNSNFDFCFGYSSPMTAKFTILLEPFSRSYISIDYMMLSCICKKILYFWGLSFSLKGLGSSLGRSFWMKSKRPEYCGNSLILLMNLFFLFSEQSMHINMSIMIVTMLSGSFILSHSSKALSMMFFLSLTSIPCPSSPLMIVC